MKIKDNIIQCSPAYMVRLLDILTEGQSRDPKRWHELLKEGQSYPQSGIYTFRCGGMLGRSGESRWYVYGDLTSVRVGHYELLAADHTRQAREFLQVVAEVERNLTESGRLSSKPLPRSATSGRFPLHLPVEDRPS